MSDQMAATAIRAPLVRLRAGRLDDGRLAALAATGDERAFEVIYDRHHRQLLGFCRHMLGSQDEGEDALQQTFLRAHRSLVTSGAPDELRPWLFAIARNRCLTMLAARKAAAVPVEELEPATEGLGDGVEQRADLRELLGDIARLPDDQRSALVLAEVGDLSHSEIAAVIEVPTAKVKALVHQARSRLIADRDARETPCEAVREQLSTARGGELRRGPLRRHLALCDGCRAYKEAVADQRSKLALVLPVLPSAGLKDTIFGALGGGGGGAAAAASGGAPARALGRRDDRRSGRQEPRGEARDRRGAGRRCRRRRGRRPAGQRYAGAPRRCDLRRAGDALGHPGRRRAAIPPARCSSTARATTRARDQRRPGRRAPREAAAERRRERAHDRLLAKRRREVARAEAKRERAADKQTRVAGREQAKQDRAVAKEQRTAERQDRLAAGPVRGNSGSGSSGTRRSTSTGRPETVAPRSQVRSNPVKPKAVATPTPVPTPSLTPARGKSDAAKGRIVEEIVP